MTGNKAGIIFFIVLPFIYYFNSTSEQGSNCRDVKKTPPVEKSGSRRKK
jgi:hypothetical protein